MTEIITNTQPPRILGNDLNNALCFVGYAFQCDNIGKKAYSLLQLFYFAGLRLKPFLIERVAFHDMLAQNVCGPDAELGAPFGVHAVSNRNDGVQIVGTDFSMNSAF